MEIKSTEKLKLSGGRHGQSRVDLFCNYIKRSVYLICSAADVRNCPFIQQARGILVNAVEDRKVGLSLEEIRYMQ